METTTRELKNLPQTFADFLCQDVELIFPGGKNVNFRFTNHHINGISYGGHVYMTCDQYGMWRCKDYYMRRDEKFGSMTGNAWSKVYEFCRNYVETTDLSSFFAEGDKVKRHNDIVHLESEITSKMEEIEDLKKQILEMSTND